MLVLFEKARCALVPVARPAAVAGAHKRVASFQLLELRASRTSAESSAEHEADHEEDHNRAPIAVEHARPFLVYWNVFWALCLSMATKTNWSNDKEIL